MQAYQAQICSEISNSHRINGKETCEENEQLLKRKANDSQGGIGTSLKTSKKIHEIYIYGTKSLQRAIPLRKIKGETSIQKPTDRGSQKNLQELEHVSEKGTVAFTDL